MPHTNPFIFCEITEEALLEKLFFHRRQFFFNALNDHLDIDEYDVHARHYGLFCGGKNEHTLAGYIRIIWDNEEKYNAQAIEKIAYKYNLEIPRRRFVSEAFDRFKLDIKSTVDEHFIQGRNLEFIICEPDCLFLLPQFRSLKLTQFMIECAMVVICASPIFPVGIVDVTENHKVLYQRNGFDILTSIAPGDSNEKRHLMAISYEGVNTRLNDLEARIRHYHDDKQFTTENHRLITKPT